MNKRCGCCEGTEAITPETTANRPGLDALAYRVGTHATFLETMQARLSSAASPALAGLTTRDSADPAIALLDAWACVGDVLTFYQERIANEGYLRTATERRSVRELAQLVGYRPRPGVASCVYLAFNLEEGRKTTIPAGTRAQSLPGQGELPQPFETAEKLEARGEWNAIKPRMTRPQLINEANAETLPFLYLKGTATNLKPNDVLLIVLGNPGKRVTRRVQKVEPQPAENRTKVTLQDVAASGLGMITAFYLDAALITQIKPIEQKPAALQLKATQTFTANTASTIQMVSALQSLQLFGIYQLLRKIATPPAQVKIYAFRVTASLFGHNCPGSIDEITIDKLPQGTLWLDNAYDQIMPESYVVVRDKDGSMSPYKVDKALSESKSTSYTFADPNDKSKKRAAAFSGKITAITLKDNKSAFNEDATIRGTIVYAQSEELTLADEPVTENLSEGATTVELDDLYDGLEPGRLLIVSGEQVVKDGQTDVATGVEVSELVTLTGVKQAPDPLRPGDTTHSTLILAGKGLRHTYKRDTVTIYANVVRATHGETRSEVLGSGDATQPFQSFELRYSPLTYLSAATASGAQSTLVLRVEGVRWREAEHMAGLGRSDRVYVTSADDEARTTVTFGEGQHGARLPTGSENIRATYRSGIGSGGNVVAGKISQLATRPLGVKGVTNPKAASGGADPETRDQARRNAPLAVMALDRLVSVQDYADFARTFAGIGKARAVRLTDGRRTMIHLTIGALDASPIDIGSELYTNLVQALHCCGDPAQPLQVDPCERMLLLIKARVRLMDNYEWALVEPKIRTALRDTFGYERRELGQDVALSEVISTIQQVPGVEYVDVDLLGGIPSNDSDGQPLDQKAIAGQVANLKESMPAPRITVNLARRPKGVIRPAQIAYLTQEIAETLILEQIP